MPFPVLVAQFHPLWMEKRRLPVVGLPFVSLHAVISLPLPSIPLQGVDSKGHHAVLRQSCVILWFIYFLTVLPNQAGLEIREKIKFSPMVAVTVKSIKILSITLVFNFFKKFRWNPVCFTFWVLASVGIGQRQLATVGFSQHLRSTVHLALCMQGGDVFLSLGTWWWTCTHRGQIHPRKPLCGYQPQGSPNSFSFFWRGPPVPLRGTC